MVRLRVPRLKWTETAAMVTGSVRRVCALVTLLPLLGQVLSAHCQSPPKALSQYSQRTYTTDQGLPQDEVRSIAQTPDGYLWFSTRNGLARFDGLRFTVFRKENTPGLGHNMLGALLVDHAGRLWIATADGLTCYQNGSFRRYTVHDGLPDDAIHSLFEDRDGKLWVGTWKGLAEYDGHRFRILGEQDGLPNRAIAGVVPDAQNGLWIGTFGGGVIHLAGAHATVYTDKDGLPANEVENIFRDTRGHLWVGTLKGFARLGPSGRFERIPELDGTANAILEDRQGVLWVSTDHFFGRLDKSVSPHFLPEKGLPKVTVESMFEDREGSLWVGTYGSGVARYRKGDFTAYAARDGLASDRTLSLFEDSQRRLWIGALNGLTTRTNGKLAIAARKAELGSNEVRAIAEDAGGRIWVGTEGGLARLDAGRWIRFGGRGQIPSDIHALYSDRVGRLWVGSLQGITVMDHGRISKITDRDGLPGNYVMAIIEDRNGGFWIGTTNGLAYWNNGKIRVYTKADGLISECISSIYQDSDGALWLSTPSGLHRWKNGKVHAFTAAEGMFAGTALHVLEDDRQRLWISTYHGIFRFDKNQLNAVADGKAEQISYVSYGTDDGLKSATCTGFGVQAGGVKTRDGGLWFPTEHGIAVVQPAASGSAPPAPSTLIESVLVDGKPFTGTVISPGSRRMEIRFNAPTSVAPEAVEFRYRMAGFENAWQQIGAERTVSFTTLPQGNYRFEVESRRLSGVWSAAGGTYALRVLPHFYETSWFYVGCVLSFAMAGWFFHATQLRRAQDRFRAVIDERSRVAQELHDTMLQSLTGTAMQIQAAIRRIGQGDTHAGIEQLNLGILHLEKAQADARQSIWDLRGHERKDSLDDALHAACRQLCSDGPELEFTSQGEIPSMDPALVQQVYRVGAEAVSNAVRHSGTERIKVLLNYECEKLRLQVQDYGCGFSLSLAGHRFLRHWGLSGMKERANRCGGSLTIKTVPRQGTLIELEVPLPNGRTAS